MSPYWKKMAVAQLKQHEAMCLAADNLEAELRNTRVVGAVGSHKRLDALVKKRTLEARAGSCRQQADRVGRALMILSPYQRMVLEMLCVRPQKGNVERLCGILACEKSTVYRRRDKALQLFTMALYGR